ncbi:MAG: hypothetical protein JXL97_07380 [Bacteroidales bacterium]|nr:hypothetical protein [Bacteroidales bacterium]
MKFFRKASKLFVLLTIPALLALFFNNSTNKHYHISNDGCLIEVAHPFGEKCKDSEHPAESKSKSEDILFSLIFSAFSDEISQIVFDLHSIFFEFNVIEQVIYNSFYKSISDHYRGRAPPVF